jgi:hypothetical protein
MIDILHQWFSWPTLPFSVLLSAVVGYWLLVIAGAFDLDFLDFDIDLDVDGHESVFDWGLVGLRWFNLGDVPLMVWASAFALPAWLASTLFDKGVADPTTKEIAIAVLRDIGIGLVAAKIITTPLKGRLKLVEPNPIEDMIGRSCVITSLEATPDFGQAQCQAEGAPLMLNVRAVEGVIPKGGQAEIVDYSAEQRVYFVRSQTV